MTPRRILFSLLAVAFGAVLGIVLNEVRHADDPAPLTAGTSEAATPTPAASEPVRIGDPDPEPAPDVPELRSLNTLFTGVSARVTPVVVYVRVETDMETGTPVPDDGFHNDLGPFPPRRRTSAGSGVILSPDGYVVTNDHVVAGASTIRVLLDDKREFEAELIGSDPTTDLAVIRLLTDGDEEPLPVANLGDSDDLEVGEWVLAVGNPFRLTSTVTAGIVSALSRQVDIIEDSFRIEDFIQTDAAINPGNSGGALVNLRGEVVGVVTAIATESGAYEGYGFVVPINLVERVATDLIERGTVERGYLGVEIRQVTAADARELGLRRVEGVLVASVARGGGADQAGLRGRDVLLSVDGEPVNAPNQFQSRVALRRPGEAVRLEIWRDGERRTVEAELIGQNDDSFQRWIAALGDRRPPDTFEELEPAPPEAPRYDAEDWGIRFRDLTPQERRAFGVSAGAYVDAIQPGSAGEVDGLPEGTVVTRVEGRAVATAEEARAALADLAAREASALLRVRRLDGLTAFYDLQSPYVE